MTQKHPQLELEYSQINDNIRFLAELRFKLLALVPALGGAAVFVLARAGLEAGKTPASSNAELYTVIAVGLSGFLVALGITLYDLRNSALYNALIHRAKHLEREFGVPSTPGGLRISKAGGQFNERPERGRRLLFTARHDLALALIYGPVLGAWSFPVVYGTLRLFGTPNEYAQLAATGTAALATLIFTRKLVAIDDEERRLYNEAAERDGIAEKQAAPLDLSASAHVA